MSSEALDAVADLSEAEVERLLSQLGEQLSQEPTQVRNPYEIPENPFLIRNLSYLYHFFKRKARMRLHGDAILLSQSGEVSREQVVQIMDRYFRYGYSGRLAERGGYSFVWVLQVVTRFMMIREELGLPLSDEPIVVFGSFPSGLANLYLSDVDITVPKALEPRYKRAESKIEARLHAQLPAHPQYEEPGLFSQVLSLVGLAGEKPPVRKNLELNYYAPADDYRDIDPSVRASNTEVLSFLNPVNIKIYADRVES